MHSPGPLLAVVLALPLTWPTAAQPSPCSTADLAVGRQICSTADLALAVVGEPEPVPVVLDGTHAVVRWRNPDPGVSRVVVRRLVGTVAPTGPADGTPVFDGAPVPGAGLQLVTDTVTVATTYTYGYWSFDASGDVSAEATHGIKATAPAVLVTPVVTSDVGTGTAFGLSWGTPANPVGTPYTVKYATRDAATGIVSAWVIWLHDTHATHAVFGAGGSPLRPAQGTTYRFEVLSQDPYFNDTQHALATVVEPYDTTSALPSKGWKTVASSRRWGGTVSVSSRPGATLTFHVVGSQVTLIADTCPGCGRAVVRVDGTLRAVADTHARTLLVSRKVVTVSGLVRGPHTVVIAVVGTAGHPALHVDGLAALN